ASRGGARHPCHRGLWSDRRTYERAALDRGPGRPDARGLVPSVLASRVSPRSCLHAGCHGDDGCGHHASTLVKRVSNVSRERLLAVVSGFRGRRVLVAGDIIADQFIYGQIARVSREAPVLILKYDTTEMVGGGAGNAANNVSALSGRAVLAGI